MAAMALALAWLQIGTATLSAGRKKAGDVKISDVELLVVQLLASSLPAAHTTQSLLSLPARPHARPPAHRVR
jgi:hypothetical protein